MPTPRVLVAMPAMGMMPSVAHFAIVAMIEYDWDHHRYIVGHQHSHSTIIHEARNNIVRNFLGKKRGDQPAATHLLFLDSDMTPPPDGLQKLVEVEGDIVCGLFTNRTFDSRGGIKLTVCVNDGAGAYKPLDLKARSFEELEALGAVDVDACGMAFTLIRREVFEKVPEPWFDFFFDRENKKFLGGEDFNFCRNAQKAGFKIQCRPSCVVGHVGTFEYNVADAWACEDQAKEDAET